MDSLSVTSRRTKNRRFHVLNREPSLSPHLRKHTRVSTHKYTVVTRSWIDGGHVMRFALYVSSNEVTKENNVLVVR